MFILKLVAKIADSTLLAFFFCIFIDLQQRLKNELLIEESHFGSQPKTPKRRLNSSAGLKAVVLKFFMLLHLLPNQRFVHVHEKEATIGHTFGCSVI